MKNRRIKNNQVFLAIFIFLLPVTLYTHLFFNEAERTLNLLNWSISENDSNLIFILLSKSIPLVMMTIWFLACYEKWSWVITIPIFCWINSLFFGFDAHLDDVEIWFGSIIFSVLYISILILFKKRFNLNRSANYFLVDLVKLKTTFNSIQLGDVNGNIPNLNSNSTYLKTLINLEKQISKLILNQKSPSKKIKSLGIGVLIIISILCSVSTIYWSNYLFFRFPELAPFLGLSETPFGFLDVYVFIWVLSLKIALLIPVLVWFLTSPNWWRYALLSTIILYSFQIWEILQDSFTVDEISFYYAAPWLLIILALVLFLDKKVGYANYIMETKEEIKIKIDEILNSQEYKNEKLAATKVNFENIKFGNNISNNTKLNELIRMREELLRNLNG